MFSWLRSTEAERLRQIEIERRLLPLHIFVSAALAIGLILLFFFYPFDRALESLAVAFVVWPVGLYGVRRMPHSSWPLAWLALQDVGVGCALAFGVWWSGGVASPILPILVLTIMMVGARYRGAPLVAVMAVVWACMAVACIAGNPAALAQMPLLATSWTCVFITTGVMTSMLAGSERSARSEAVADPLTSLLNRKALELRLGQLRVELARHPEAISAIVCDLDGFKEVNDLHGHEAGDVVLQDVADVLRVVLRETDLVYRLGGDEFLVLLPHTDVDTAVAVAERVRTSVERRRPGQHDVTASVGVAGAQGAHIDLDTLIVEADKALYEAKAAGRNVVHLRTWGDRPRSDGAPQRMSDAA